MTFDMIGWASRIAARTARRHWMGALTLAIALFAAGAAQAQFRTAIQGVVTDTTGAVIPGATVTLKNNATNETVTHKSDAAGVYNFNALPAADFTLTVSQSGFQQKVLEHLQLIPEQANSVNVSLGVSGADVSVNVDASTNDAVDTETPNIGGTINSNDIQHLPSFNRDVFTLTQLIPGAISDGSQSAGGGVYATPGTQGPGGSGNSGAAPTENGPQANANGGQYETNSISIDGISTVSAVWGGTTIITPTEDSIDNVRVVTNDYDAENGRFSGAQTLVTSKSGTNQLHGSAFIAIHRPGLNAYQPAVRTSDGSRIGAPVRDTQRYNQYGASLGGPIIKDKIFAFFAYESSPNSSTATANGWYETAAFRSAASSGSVASKYLGFAGSAPIGSIVTTGETCTVVGLAEGVNCVTIPGQGLDIGSPIKTGLGKQDLTSSGTAATPGVGGGLDGVADVAYYATSVPTISHYQQYAGRLDANASAADHLSFTIYWVPQDKTSYNGGARAYNLFNHNQINEALAVIWNHTFSSSMLNEARANAAGWRWNEVTSNPQQPVGLAQDNITLFGPNATLNQFGTSVGSDLNQWTYTYKDVATKVAGRHTIKFGGEYTNLHYLNNPVGHPTYGFYNIWDFLNDAPSTESGNFNSVTGLPGGTRNDDRNNLFGFFVQDQWRVLSNLTVNAGIRYSYFGALYAKQNNLPHVVLSTGSSSYTGMSVVTTGSMWNPQKGNFGPQLGFNWSPGFIPHLVVRGGYGLNFNQEEIAITANLGNNPPTAFNANFAFTSPSNPGTNGNSIVYGASTNVNSLAGYPPNPNTITSYNSSGLPTKGNANIVIVGDGHGSLPTTYLHHFSLDTEYQIGRQLVASLGYQGSLGRHIINHMTPNAPAVVAGYALNPLVTGGDFWINGGSSNNNAFLAELEHPMRRGLMVDAQFMWAKSLDTDGSGPYYEDPYFPLNPAYSYGPSEFNVGKSFKLWGEWQPLLFHGNNLLEKVAGGWTLTGIYQLHTGFPYSPTYSAPSSLYCTQCGLSNLRPYYLGGGKKGTSNSAFINNTNFPNYSAAAKAAVTSTAVINCAVTSPNYPKCLTPAVVSYSNAYFSVPNYYNAIESQSNAGFPSPNIALPAPPGLGRNAFVGPGYRDVDASLSKGFGIPNNRLLGEHAQFEIRAEVFNLFNILNLNPTGVSSNVTASNFGQDTSALGGRTITMQARFSF